jgi:hypothetical protein
MEEFYRHFSCVFPQFLHKKPQKFEPIFDNFSQCGPKTNSSWPALAFKESSKSFLKFKWFRLSLAVTINSWKIPENVENYKKLQKKMKNDGKFQKPQFKKDLVESDFKT